MEKVLSNSDHQFFEKRAAKNMIKSRVDSGGNGFDKIGDQPPSYPLEGNFPPPPSGDTDLFLAFYDYDFGLYLDGHFCKVRSEYVFTGDVQTSLFDRYSFAGAAEGSRTPFGFLPGIAGELRNIQEWEFAEIEAWGYTMPFEVRGEKTRRMRIKFSSETLPDDVQYIPAVGY